MSFKNCIDNAEKEGAIDKDRADRLRAAYDRWREQLEFEYGADAEAEAARRTFDEAKFEATERRRRKLLQAKIGGALAKRQTEFRNFLGNPDRGEFMVNLVADETGKLGDQSSVLRRYFAIRQRATGRMGEAISAFERDALTRSRNKPLQRETVRAAFGAKDVSAEARRFANAWDEAADFLRRRFNAAGGHIGKLENWGMPQQWDGVAVRRAGYEAFRADLLNELDRGRMIDNATGRPFTDQKLELALREAYETISTEGANKVTPSGAAGGRALANRRADHRFLIFKDGEAWLRMQEKYGEGDAFAAMMAHLDAMSRDVAAMEILGPNPTATLRLLEQSARKAAGVAGETGQTLATPLGGTRRKIAEAWNMWDHFTGAALAPVNGFAARSLSTTRNVLTSAQLGTAWFSSLTDQAFGAFTRGFNGLPASRQLSDTIQLMASKATRTELARAGVVSEGAMRATLDQARYLNELNVNGISGRMAEATLRLSLLEPWTRAGQLSFQMDTLGALAARAGRSIDSLKGGAADDRAFARMLDRYGLAGAWDEIRTTRAYEPDKGAKFIRPEDIAARTDLPPARADWLANRVLEMVRTEMEFAVPSASLRSRAGMSLGMKRGSFFGEIVASGLMYKSFASTVSYLQISRVMAEIARTNVAGGIAYIAPLTIGLTLGAGIVLQLRELKAGRDPRPMDEPRFWMAAMMQGGGVGIFGDFLFADVNRYGGGLPSTAAGPVVGLADDARELTIGNLDAALIEGDDPRLGRDGVLFLRRYTPGGNIWYAEMAYHRLILDNLQRVVDPDADEYFRRRARSRERDYGNSYFWAPGETTPSRAPDLENAGGGER